MSVLIKSALQNSEIQSTCFQLRVALFHSTTVLERGRRNYWNSRYNNGNNRRSRRSPFRQHIMHDINSYAEYLLNKWQDHDDEPFNKGPSWFRQPHGGPRRSFTSNRGRQNKRRGLNFCEEDNDDVDEAFFRVAYGDRFCFWSFVHHDYPNWRTSTRNSNRYNTSWKRRHRFEDEYEYTSEDDSAAEPDLASERTALGLSASGPLKIEDVKTAYRTCALKWHPDRHQGSSKAAAEEKFKLCTAAYQSLCDSLEAN